MTPVSILELFLHVMTALQMRSFYQTIFPWEAIYTNLLLSVQYFFIPVLTLHIVFVYLQVGTNGLISFGRSYEESNPEVFPSTNPDTFWRYLVAPFWADLSSTNGGNVSYAIYTYENSSSLLNNVNQLIQTETSDGGFVGTWMLVGYWENLPSPYFENKVRRKPDPQYVQEAKKLVSTLRQCLYIPGCFK